MDRKTKTRLALSLLLKTHPRRDAIMRLITSANHHERNRHMPQIAEDDNKEIEVNQELLARLKSLDICGFNAMAEKLFVAITNDYITQEGPQPVNSILAEGAFMLDVSIETIKRYLMKHTARSAEFRIDENKLVSIREA